MNPCNNGRYTEMTINTEHVYMDSNNMNFALNKNSKSMNCVIKVLYMSGLHFHNATMI